MLQEAKQEIFKLKTDLLHCEDSQVQAIKDRIIELRNNFPSLKPTLHDSTSEMYLKTYE